MWRGLVLNSPLMGVEGGLILRMQMKVGAVLAALAPHAKLVPAAQPSTLSQDPEVVRGPSSPCVPNVPKNQLILALVVMQVPTLSPHKATQS